MARPKTHKDIPTQKIHINTQISYNPNSDEFDDFVIDHPLSLCYQVTLKCNYSCPHCISSSGYTHPEGLSTSEVKKVLSKIRESGVMRLDLTGGEPFIRRDIDELLTYAVKDLKLSVVVTTNGSLMTHDHAVILAKLGIMTQISLDGPESINDSLRGKGSYANAVRAIKLLKKEGVRIRINCLIQRKSIGVLKPMVDIVKKLGIDHLYFIIVSAQGRANDIRDSICLSREEEKKIHKEIVKLQNNSKVTIKMLDYKRYMYSCNVIDPDGNFTSQSWDQDNRVTVGNILKQDLKVLWKNANAFDHLRHLLQYTRHKVLYG
ncbi:MAG: radical SAM protein [bacterium]